MNYSFTFQSYKCPYAFYIRTVTYNSSISSYERYDDGRYDDHRYDDHRYEEETYDERHCVERYDDEDYDDEEYDDEEYDDETYDERYSIQLKHHEKCSRFKFQEPKI